jgi:hypothetical protein
MNGILTIAATCMEIDNYMLGEISQIQNYKYHMFSLLHSEVLKGDPNE